MGILENLVDSPRLLVAHHTPIVAQTQDTVCSERLDAEIKARLPQAHKIELNEIARARHLKLADIVREAIREHLERNSLASLP